VVSSDKEISPQGWLKHAMNLNWLLLDSRKKIINAEHNIAVEKSKRLLIFIDGKKTSNADAQNYVETLDSFRDCELLKAEVKTIEEFIRIAKKYSESVIELGG
jgi:hypothetical protein